MEKVSAVMIVYNEEKNLRACLDTVTWADEIVVVDSHSQDRTLEIAKDYTDKIFQREYKGHIDKKRFAVSKATHDWVFSIDADERATPELAREIRSVLEKGGGAFAGFDMPRITWHLGRWIRHGEWYPDRVARFFRKGRMRYEGTEPHDRVILEGPRGHFKGKLLHYNYRNFAHQIATVQAYSEQAAQALFEQGRHAGWINLLFRPGVKFLKCFLWKRGFLDGWPGFIIAVTSAFYVLAKYTKLYERERLAGGERGVVKDRSPSQAGAPDVQRGSP
ncbi:MAG: glycosyltransferase family 2 protein [Planctomycetota bacterium]|jgi:glycosyltransferase involved in cell wall biosynthesis